MASTLFLCQAVDSSLEFLVWCDCTWFCKYLTSFDLFLLNTAEQDTYVVSSFSLIHCLVEHLDAGNYGASGLFDTYDLNCIANLYNTSLDSSCSYCTTAGNREDILYWHQEWLVDFSLWEWEICIHCIKKLLDALCLLRVVWMRHSLECRSLDDRTVRIETVLLEKFLNLYLYQLNQLWVSQVHLVKEYNQFWNTNLSCKKDVLSCLWLWTRVCSNQDDCTVHLSGTGDHVLYIVGMARAVYVSVVSLVCLILDMSCVDGDTSSLLFWCIVDIIIVHYLSAVLLCTVHRNCCGKSCLTMVYVSDCTNVNVWFGPFKFLFCH